MKRGRPYRTTATSLCMLLIRIRTSIFRRMVDTLLERTWQTSSRRSMQRARSPILRNFCQSSMLRRKSKTTHLATSLLSKDTEMKVPTIQRQTQKVTWDMITLLLYWRNGKLHHRDKQIKTDQHLSVIQQETSCTTPTTEACWDIPCLSWMTLSSIERPRTIHCLELLSKLTWWRVKRSQGLSLRQRKAYSSTCTSLRQENVGLSTSHHRIYMLVRTLRKAQKKSRYVILKTLRTKSIFLWVT